jgi:excinuclease ABC subunit B
MRSGAFSGLVSIRKESACVCETRTIKDPERYLWTVRHVRHDHLKKHKPFVVKAPWGQTATQREAVEKLAESLENGNKWTSLTGVTGSGKSAVMAWTIEHTDRPALVIAPNKSLAAQLSMELAELLPENKVCYFVSYYDYYQPEAYVPSSDTFIEKEAMINQEIDRLRHEATASLLFRRDVVVVASVSCVYGLGAPESYLKNVLRLEVGQHWERLELSRKLAEIGYVRGDGIERSTFKMRGDTLEIIQPSGDTLHRVSFDDEIIEEIVEITPVERKKIATCEDLNVWPAKHYQTERETLERACGDIETELQERLEELRGSNKLLEAQRLEQRTLSDVDYLRETGFCPGVENYSRHLDGRVAGEPPYSLLSYFPSDALIILDESHVTIPQLRACFAGDFSRKATLIEHGFRLPSAADNRPLKFEEFSANTGQVLTVSATPGVFEREMAGADVELLVRPTGLLDPEITVERATGQVEHLAGLIKKNTLAKERTLVTCTTKMSAEKLVEHLEDRGIKARYLHSDVHVTERIEIVRDLRLGEFDVLVGVNLLREGLDMPEVSLVAILDADQEGFLRSETALIQTIGRAARHLNGRAVLYADRETEAMRRAIEETARRRETQAAYNKEHGIVPRGVVSSIKPALIRQRKSEKSEQVGEFSKVSTEELEELLIATELEMHQAAEDLRFEVAVVKRDKLGSLSAEILSRAGGETERTDGERSPKKAAKKQRS